MVVGLQSGIQIANSSTQDSTNRIQRPSGLQDYKTARTAGLHARSSQPGGPRGAGGFSECVSIFWLWARDMLCADALAHINVSRQIDPRHPGAMNSSRLPFTATWIFNLRRSSWCWINSSNNRSLWRWRDSYLSSNRIRFEFQDFPSWPGSLR